VELDVDAKISQLQVLFRFAASAVGPLLASKLLLPLLAPSQAYLGLAGIVLGLCVFLTILVTMIQADSSQAEDRFVFIVPETIKTLSDNNASILPPIDQIKVEVGWREVVPKWLQNGLCYFCFSSSNSSLATEDPGYFTQAWVDCGLLNGLTEVVRAGYARILCLRALSMGLSPTELARALAITGTTAVATFWLSDIADRNRRLSSFLRHCFLFAHFIKFLLSNYFIMS
jgi:hypothetical protein